MVLHRSNFVIPARFSFQPYSVEWRLVSAEIVDWVEEPKLRQMMSKPPDDPEKTWLRVRIEVPEVSGSEGVLRLHIPGIGIYPSHTVHMDRASIPADVLLAHENHRNTPDVADRWFRVLICQKPEFKYGLWALGPGEVTKSAWIMRDEFINLEADPDPALGWGWSVRRFLNKWGIWEQDKGYTEDWTVNSLVHPRIPLSALMSEQKSERPDFLLVMPHLLKKQQEKYRKALLPGSRLSWLRSHRLEHTTADEFPFIRVRRSFCSEAIEATITIDHIERFKFGICKRCHKVFQKETRHKKSYCSERCFNAAGVHRWREKQRKAAKKGAKGNAKG